MRNEGIIPINSANSASCFKIALKSASSGILIDSVNIDLTIGILVGPPIGITRSMSVDFRFASLRICEITVFDCSRIGWIISSNASLDNVPDKLIGRHPFPGPGLAIRIPGEITEESISILQKADSIFIEEIRNANLYDKIWQAFCVLLPVKSVGVMGDSRSYDKVLVLRAITSVDGMTADVFAFEHSFLNRVSTRIVNEVKGINRVTYDITSKPPGTIEWE